MCVCYDVCMYVCDLRGFYCTVLYCIVLYCIVLHVPDSFSVYEKTNIFDDLRPQDVSGFSKLHFSSLQGEHICLVIGCMSSNRMYVLS